MGTSQPPPSEGRPFGAPRADTPDEQVTIPERITRLEIRPLIDRPADPPPDRVPAPGSAIAETPDIGEEQGGVDPGTLADLQHPSARRRLETLRSLAADPGSAPIVGVAARLQDPDPSVREAAVTVLQAHADEHVLLLLLDAAEDPSDRVRRAARRAIRRHAGPALTELLRRELAVPARRRAAAAVLEDLREKDRRSSDERATGPRTPSREDVTTTEEIERLRGALEDRRTERRRRAAERLGELRASGAVDALAERLLDPDRGVRIKAAEALGRIGDLGAERALRQALIWDTDPGVAVVVGRALRALTGPMRSRTIRV